MQNYKITWELNSPLQTPLHSDTIFGHLCWAYLYAMGEVKLKEFLLQAAKGNFILSSGFPSGCLPKPILPENQQILDELFEKHLSKSGNSEMIYQNRKSLKKKKFISYDLWKKLMNNFSIKALYEELITTKDFSDPAQYRSLTNFRNKINRLSGSTAEGSLYGERLQIYSTDTTFESYLKTDLWDIEEIQQYFNFIENSGYGKKKSVGRGNFKISVKEFDMHYIDAPNAHLVLSNMIPSEDDPPDAYWNGNIKYGKVGGSLAFTEAPFKYPFYHFLPGSVFLGETPPKGKIVEKIHPDKPELVQNLFCYSIPFKWEDRDEQ